MEKGENMVRFGPSGNCELFYSEGHTDSVEAPKWLNQMGLTAYEYGFTLGRFLSKEKSEKILSEAKKYDIKISVHAPYYINFCNTSPVSVENNAKYVLNSLRGLKMLGGTNCVVHVGSQMKLSREEAFKNMEKGVKDFLDLYYQEDLLNQHINPETMGKFSNIGTVDEILEICSWDKALYPCFDFGHINSITQGSLKTKDDFLRIFDKAINKLGFEKVNDCHIHFSKIKYGEKGEIVHLTFDDNIYGPNYEPFLESVKELKINPSIISESKGTQAQDAKTMSEYFKKI